MADSVFASKAIQAVIDGQLSFCKFLSANDTGDTGSHQVGIYIGKNSIPILFDRPGIRGENKDKFVKIKWQDDFITNSRFIYYGVGTRNEYRITRFERGFPFLKSDHTGDLLVLVKVSEEDYTAYVLSSEDEINEFLNAFGMSPIDTGSIIETDGVGSETKLDIFINRFISSLDVDFPSSFAMSTAARRIHHDVFNHDDNTINDPDKQIINWTEMEYRLFRNLEHASYGAKLTKGFNSIEEFIEMANMVLNRRKSRAGKSLEHHLSAIFDGNKINYVSQPRTEGNKRPDFIFPNEFSYHNASYPSEKLVFLGAKTTCKDRWRQIINEANRIGEKHLFTLQQGISSQQLEEMAAERVVLVVPRPFIDAYPREKRGSIWTLKKFIEFTREKTRE